MRWIGWLCAALGLVAACPGARGGAWRCEVGPALRLGMDAAISGSTYSQQSSAGLDKFGRAATDISSFANRSFDDGFVFLDPSTVDFGGDTWNWGYRDASQYDAAAGTLTFTLRQDLGAVGDSSDQTIATTLRDDRLDLRDDLNGVGVGFTVERDLLVREYDRLSLAAGVVGLWGAEARMEASTYAEDFQSSRESATTTRIGQYVYVYDLMGVVPPSAPYSGTYAGPGPLIPNRPASVSYSEIASTRTRRESAKPYRLANRSEFEVAAAIYEGWIGPRLVLKAFSTVDLLLTPYVSLSLVDGQMDQTERLEAVYPDGSVELVNQWRHAASEQDVLVGFGAQGGLRWRPTERLSFAAMGGYEWVPQEFEVDAGPNRFTLDISGFQATLEIGWML